MDKKRIQVYADAETKRRIELAAAQHAVAVTEYCLAAIKLQLGEDDLLDAESVEITVKPAPVADVIAELRALQQAIKMHRKGKLVDVDHIVDDLRDERAHELSRLH